MTTPLQRPKLVVVSKLNLTGLNNANNNNPQNQTGILYSARSTTSRHHHHHDPFVKSKAMYRAPEGEKVPVAAGWTTTNSRPLMSNNLRRSASNNSVVGSALHSARVSQPRSSSANNNNTVRSTSLNAAAPTISPRPLQVVPTTTTTRNTPSRFGGDTTPGRRGTSNYYNQINFHQHQQQPKPIGNYNAFRRGGSVSVQQNNLPPTSTNTNSSLSFISAEELNAIEMITVGSSSGSQQQHQQHQQSSSSAAAATNIITVPSGALKVVDYEYPPTTTKYLQSLGLTRAEVKVIQPSCVATYSLFQSSFGKENSGESSASSIAAGFQISVVSRFSSHPVVLAHFRIDEIRRLEYSTSEKSQQNQLVHQLLIGCTSKENSHSSFVVLQVSSSSLSSSSSSCDGSSRTNEDHAKLSFLYKFLHARSRGTLPTTAMIVRRRNSSAVTLMAENQNDSHQQQQQTDLDNVTHRNKSPSPSANQNNNNDTEEDDANVDDNLPPTPIPKQREDIALVQHKKGGNNSKNAKVIVEDGFDPRK